jgi:hypothetical protein
LFNIDWHCDIHYFVNRSHLEYYTREVHYASSSRDYDTVEWTASQWRSYGLVNVTIEPFPCQVSLPISASVAIVSPNDKIFQCSLSEDIVDGDVSTQSPWRNRTWAGGAPSGIAEGPLVNPIRPRPSACFD